MMKKFRFGKDLVNFAMTTPIYKVTISDGDAVTLDNLFEIVNSDPLFIAIKAASYKNGLALDDNDICNSIMEHGVDAFMMRDNGTELLECAIVCSNGYAHTGNVFGYVFGSLTSEAAELKLINVDTWVTSPPRSTTNRVVVDTPTPEPEELEDSTGDITGTGMCTKNPEPIMDSGIKARSRIRHLSDTAIDVWISGPQGIFKKYSSSVKELEEVAADYITDNVGLINKMDIAINQYDDSPTSCLKGKRKLRVSVNYNEKPIYIATLISVCAMNGVSLTLYYVNNSGTYHPHVIFD